MNIMIAGCGRIGKAIAGQLCEEKHEITMMDIHQDALTSATNSMDVIGYYGDCTSYRAQLEAGVEDADLMIAVTNQDEKNMLTCLVAKKAGRCRTIARVRSPQYSQEIGYLREELGLSMAINPEFVAAAEIVRLIQIPSALEVDTFAKGRISLISLDVPDGSILDGMLLKDMPSKVGASALICIVERNGQFIIPGGFTEIRAGDRISVTLSLADVSDFLNKIGIRARRIRSVLIAGGGTIAYYLAKRLIELRIDVKIIEKDPERCDELAELLPKAMIIQGDATDKALLTEESAEDMDAVCALMAHDEENILLSLHMKKTSEAKVMTLVTRNSYEDIAGELPIGRIISPKKITAEYITRFVRSMHNEEDSDVIALYQMKKGKVESLEFSVGNDAKIIGKQLKDLNLKENTLLACIAREREIIRPGGRDMIMAGDSVVVVTTQKGLKSIDEILK